MAHGIEVYDEDGSTAILSPNVRIGLILARETISLDTNNPSQLIEVDMTGLTTANSVAIFTGTFASVDTQENIVSRQSNGFLIDITGEVSSFSAIATIIRF